MAIKLATPGVYIEERSAFPNSVAAVPTAVPAFIGYTEKTTRNGQSLLHKPVRINSLTDYLSIFGGGFSASFDVKETSGAEFDVSIGGKNYQVVPATQARFILFESIRLYFANGGGTCYIVSAGGYYEEAKPQAPRPEVKDKDGKPVPAPAASAPTAPKPNQLSKKALEDGLAALILEDEPTMVVIPEAVMLEKADCYALQQAMLMHAGYKMRDRFALLDVYDGFQARSYDEKDVITQFREGVGNNFLDFGAAYYPWVYTSIVQNEEVSFRNLANLTQLADLLTQEATEAGGDAKRTEEIKTEVAKLKNNPGDSLSQTLKVISPAYKVILEKVKMQLNILPPSAGMAGVYTATDNTRGVWKAPANVGFNSVITPVVKLTHEDQEDLNVTVTGKSVNAIRTFTGEGPVVWGARTLDGNSQDWRYVNVRRTMIYIEQSIKFAAKAYVFEPNTSATWVLVRSMISSFLNDLWKQGGLVGLTPTDAYEVLIGLGSTMTPNDILDGVMRITVKVAVSRPAEFIVITFEQKMQES
ncbi:MAG: hypothetical protein OHK0053_12050 [Microscillaceae bacterium]